MKEYVFLAPVTVVVEFAYPYLALEHLCVYSREGGQSSLFPQEGEDGFFVPARTPIKWPSEWVPGREYAGARWRWAQYLITRDADVSWGLELELTPPPGETFQPRPGGPHYAALTTEVAYLTLAEREPGRTKCRLSRNPQPVWLQTKEPIYNIFVLQSDLVCERLWQTLRHRWTQRDSLPAVKRQDLANRLLPKRNGDRRRWRAAWRLIRPEADKGKPAAQIADWLAKSHSDWLCNNPETVTAIIKAGYAGLLDDDI